MRSNLESVRPVGDLELAKVVLDNFNRVALLKRYKTKVLVREREQREEALREQWPMLLEASGCNPRYTWMLDFETEPPVLRRVKA